MEVQNYSAAKEMLQEAAVNEPRDPDLLYLLGKVHLHLQEYEEARTAFDSSLRISMKHVEDIQLLLEKHYRQELMAGTKAINAHDYASATRYFKKASEIKPDEHEVYPALAFSFFQLQDYDKATLYYKEAITLDPHDIESLHALAELAYQREDYSAASDYAYRALTINQRFIPTREILVYTGLMIQDYDMAERAFQGIPQDRRDQKLIKNYAIGLFNQGEFERALPHIIYLSKHDRSDVVILQALAETYYQLSHFEKMAEYYEIIWNDNPQDQEALVNIIEAYEKMGSDHKAAVFRENLHYLRNDN